MKSSPLKFPCVCLVKHLGVRLLSLMCDTGEQKITVCVCVFASILQYFLHHMALNDEGFGVLVSLYGVAHLFPGPI